MSSNLSANADGNTVIVVAGEVVQQYDVMYYKRALAGKVHRDKGVAKFDGVLTVDAGSGMVSLRPAGSATDGDDNDDHDKELFDKEEEEEEKDVSKLSWNKRRAVQHKKKTGTSNRCASNGKVLYSGVQRDTAKRTMRADDVLALGGFEVQVLGVRVGTSEGAVIHQPKTVQLMVTTLTAAAANSNAAHTPLGVKTMIAPITRKASAPLHSKRVGPAGNVVATTSSAATAARSALTTTSSGSSKASAKQPMQPAMFRKQPPEQPQLQRLPLQAKSLSTVGATKAQPQSVLPRKRPLLSSNKSISIATKQRRSVPKQPSTPAAVTTATSTTAVVATTASSNNTVLPHIPLPAAIRKVLRPHQVQGVDFLWRTLLGAQAGCILGDEMGLGKTLMTIACLSALHRRQREKQFVVVSPSSLVTNWANEFDKWLGRASQPKRVVIHKGGEEGLQQIRAYTQKMKQHLMHQPGQVLIVSYDLFRRNSDEFVFPKNTSVGLLVVDEGHRLKNTSGSLTLAALESLPTDARLCITATPIQNNLCEFYNLANFCCPGILGVDVASFRKNYERPIAAANQKNAARDQLATGLAKSKELETVSKTFMLRRLQKDVLKAMLPPRTETLLFCRPSARQCQLYRSLTKHTAIGNNMADALMTLTTLRKICSHPLLYENNAPTTAASTDPDLTLSGKLVVLDALLQQIRQKAPDDKVVIVSNFTTALSVIESLVLQPRQLSYLRLDGTTQNRQALVDTFNRTSSVSNFCFLLSSKAGGCGLNIVGANRLVMFDADWNPSTDIQAMGRIYRQGQSKPCSIYRLFTAGTVEELIYQRQAQKGGLGTLTVDAGTKQGKPKANTGNAVKFTKEELADCFTLKENCACDTKQKVGSRWPSYDDGADGLRALGCTDLPLLSVAESMADTLRFVHIANDDELFSEVPGDERASKLSVFNTDYSTETEAVVHNSDDSDSENEFDL